MPESQNFTISGNYSEILNEIEFILMKSIKTTASAPLNKSQKSKLIKKVLLIKTHIESINPAKGTK